MIERLDHMPPATVGFRCTDEIEREDYDVRHHSAWERSAIVTDTDWIARATRLFAWMIPGEARVFPLAELEVAKAWVAGDAP
jgi:hypothetical protein